MASFAQEHSSGLTISIVGHGLLVLMFAFNLLTMPFRDAAPVQLAIEATVIDMGAVRKQQEIDQQRRQLELDRQQAATDAERRKVEEAQQREQEQQRLVEQQRQQEIEQQRVAEQKQQQDIEKERLAAEQRKADAERERLAEQERQKEAARLAEQARKAEAARVAEQQRKDAERRRQEEIQRQFQSEIAAEEELLAAMSSGKMQQYKAAIIARVTRNWVKPASAKPGTECEVRVSQIPGGEIVSVRVGNCNGDAAVVRSIEAAVYRASPLPPPPDPSLFDRTLIFTFRPEE